MIKKHNKIILISGIAIVTICIISISIIFGSKIQTSKNNIGQQNSNNITEENYSAEQSQEGHDFPREYFTENKVTNPTMFFTVQSCIKQYTGENFSARKMKESIGKRIAEYGVFGYKNKKEKVYYRVALDTFNMTYEVTQYNNCNSIDDIVLKKNDDVIEKNDNNKYNYNRITEEQMWQIYYQDFLDLEKNNPELAYEMLDEDYKKNYFPTLNQFIEYLNNNLDTSESSYHTYNKKGDYSEYIIKNYKNIYTIKATAVMDYTVKIDNN